MTSTPTQETNPTALESARDRLAHTGRNDLCPCGSTKKYKKCHLAEDQNAAFPPPEAPKPDDLLMNGWRLFEQHRPGAAEKAFQSALELQPDWPDAYAGIGLCCLQAGKKDEARKAFETVERLSETLVAKLRSENVKDAFTRKEAQAYVRSCHALGCMAFDDKDYEGTLTKLTSVYAIDEGAVGTEARLIAGTALLKLNRPADAIPILETASKSEAGAGRAWMSLCLAKFMANDRPGAEAAFEEACKANAHFAKTLLRRGPRRQANLGAASPGSVDEALGYSQTYGDAWDESAKGFLEESLLKRGKAAQNPASEIRTE